MDDQRVDRLGKILRRGLNRRGVLAVLAGAAGVGASEVGKGRQRSQPRGRKATRAIVCHHDTDTNTWAPISISANGKAVAKHKARHGDFTFGSGQASGCCTDADCDDDETCVITVNEKESGSGQCVPSCKSSADCELGLVCIDNLCQGCRNREDCQRQASVVDCQRPVGQNVAVCVHLGLCTCPDVCSDCSRGHTCFGAEHPGPGCGGSLCCPLARGV